MKTGKKDEKKHFVFDTVTGKIIDTYTFNGLSPDSTELKEIKSHRLVCPECRAEAHLRIINSVVYVYARHLYSSCDFASKHGKAKARVGNKVFDFATMLEYDDANYILMALRQTNSSASILEDKTNDEDEKELELDYRPVVSTSIRELRKTLSKLSLNERITETLKLDDLLISSRNCQNKHNLDLSGIRYVECIRATPEEYVLFKKYLNEKWLLTRVIDTTTHQVIFFLIKIKNSNAFYDFRTQFFETNEKKKKKRIAFLSTLAKVTDIEGVNAYTAVLNSKTYCFFG